MTMKAVMLSDYCGLGPDFKPENISVKDVPVPAPGEEEVQISIAAASVNPIDWKIASGVIKASMPLDLSSPIGFECAGVVTKVGAKCERVKVGDSVWADLPRMGKTGVLTGAYAEFVSVKENKVGLKPSNLTFEEAAVVPLASLTALQALRGGDLKDGGSVLVLGGSGAVGICAIQIAKSMGATVYATCSTRNLEYVKSLGADEVIDYTAGKWEEVLKGKDIDTVFDSVGEKDATTRCEGVIKKGGIITSTVAQPDGSTLANEVTLKFILTDSDTIADYDHIKELVEANKLKLPVMKTFPFDKVADAFKESMGGKVVGKIAIAPAMMKACILTDYSGGKDDFKADKYVVQEVAKPTPAQGEIQIKVLGSSVNPIDWKLCTGNMKGQMPFGFQTPLGLDVSGFVTAVGPGVSRLKPGDAVWADVLTRGSRGINLGAFAEYVVTRESKVTLKPTTMSHEQAGILPLVALTALQSVRDGCGVTEAGGKSILILGGSGGVGICAIQIAKYWGNTVYATCSAKNVDFVKGLGADEVIDYTSQDWAEILKGKNIDGVFDSVGEKDALTRSYDVLKEKGMYCTVAGAPPQSPPPKEIAFKFLLTNSETVDDLNTLKKIAEEDKLKCPIDKTFSLEQVAEAFQVSMGGRTVGKIAIKVS